MIRRLLKRSKPAPRWNLLDGCKDLTTATRRARGLLSLAAAKARPTTADEFWTYKAETVLAGLLFAAAHYCGGTLTDIRAWLLTGETQLAEMELRTRGHQAVASEVAAMGGSTRSAATLRMVTLAALLSAEGDAR
jgi:hypothetical protein